MKKHLFSLLIIISVLFWALFALFFKVDNWQNHDGNYHLQRIYAATDSLRIGLFPLRWSRLLNYNCGLPVFNYFYPLIYYIGGAMGLIGISPIVSLKIILSIFYIVGTFSLYFLVYHYSKSKLVSLSGSLVFALNSYFLQLIYVRANPELLTYALIPVILLCIAKSKYLFLFISIIFYFLSHNTTVLITFPILLIFALYTFWKSEYKNRFLLLTFVLASISASFFIGPAILEKKYVKLGTEIAADYQQHFSTLKQLFVSPWGWGYSNSGTNDGMSFKFGYLQFFLLFIALIISIRHRSLLPPLLLIIFVLFLTLPPSNIIWKNISLIQQLQYPWRFLGLAVLLTSFLVPLLFKYVPKNLHFAFFVFILFFSIITNRHHIQAVPSSNIPDFTRIGTTTIADELLPITASFDCYQDSNKLSYFPKSYKITNNQQNLAYHDCSGYICINNSTDIQGYDWHYQSTPIEKIFNAISLSSMAIWLVLTFFKKKLHL